VVNAISPGSIDTPGLKAARFISGGEGEQRRKMIATVTPLGRLGTADEIAAAAVVSRLRRCGLRRRSRTVRRRRGSRKCEHSVLGVVDLELGGWS